ncbi:hypothetical protein PGH45_12650 [Legionella pneumophila]|nr:hypothetical protein [Legionella pneumophila]
MFSKIHFKPSITQKCFGAGDKALMSKYEVYYEKNSCSTVLPTTKSQAIKKEKSIRQNQAYDEAARSFGYSNYKEYLHDLKDKNRIKEILLLNIHSEKDMFKKWNSEFRSFKTLISLFMSN